MAKQATLEEMVSFMNDLALKDMERAKKTSKERMRKTIKFGELIKDSSPEAKSIILEIINHV